MREQWSSDEDLWQPVVADGNVVGEGQNGVLHAVDAGSGDAVRTYDEPSGVSLEGVSDGLVVGLRQGDRHAPRRRPGQR
ncbi:hypothetical protein [Streptomyces sp. NPDC001880]